MTIKHFFNIPRKKYEATTLSQSVDASTSESVSGLSELRILRSGISDAGMLFKRMFPRCSVED